MTHPVQYSAYLCFAESDRPTAEQIAQSIQKRGLTSCVPATGTDQTRIEADLNASRCIILILSAAANDSAVVAETVKAGVAKGKPVFPVRAEEILPSPELELYVSSTEWIDASSSALVDRLDKLVRGGRDTAPISNQEPPTKSSSGKLIGAMLLLILFAGLAAGAYFAKPYLFPPAPVESEVPSAELPEAPSRSDMTSEELVQALLRAIDSEDYAAVSVYAKALFETRRDLEITDYAGKLQPPVIAAAREGDLDLLKALAAAKPVFGLEDTRGREPLHVAAAEGHNDIIRFLIKEITIDPDDTTDGTNFTAMHWAAQSGNPDTIKLLHELGADPNAKSKRGRAPLHIAVEQQQGNAVSSLLVLDGIEVNLADNSGDTPLHLAAGKPSLTIVEDLIAHGASRGSSNALNQTPGQIAYEAAYDKTAQLLGYRPPSQ